jgi:hypothetical protein
MAARGWTPLDALACGVLKSAKFYTKETPKTAPVVPLQGFLPGFPWLAKS